MRSHATALWKAAVLAISLCSAATSAGQSVPTELSGSLTTYVVAKGDTLGVIAARFGIYPATIALDNGIGRRAALQTGRVLQIDSRHVIPEAAATNDVVVNIPQRMVFVHDDAGRIAAYPIAVGRSSWPTPTGAFAVIAKRQNPAWHPPESIRAESARAGHPLPLVVPPGPRNPLGRIWIGLSIAGIGIHGTAVQSSIYQATTHGCIRLQQDPIEQLSARVAVGARGNIIYEPILVARVGDEVFLEVHPDVYSRLQQTPHAAARRVAASAGVDDRVDWVLADREIDRQAGIARRVSGDR